MSSTRGPPFSRLRPAWRTGPPYPARRRPAGRRRRGRERRTPSPSPPPARRAGRRTAVPPPPCKAPSAAGCRGQQQMLRVPAGQGAFQGHLGVMNIVAQQKRVEQALVRRDRPDIVPQADRFLPQELLRPAASRRIAVALIPQQGSQLAVAACEHQPLHILPGEQAPFPGAHAAHGKRIGCRHKCPPPF